MAYRPFHRALGETSLELKCLFFFGLALVLVISVSSLLYWQVTKKVVYQQNPNTGRLLVDQGLVVKHWEGAQPASAQEFADWADLPGVFHPDGVGGSALSIRRV
jgi:hypothetical protein